MKIIVMVSGEIAHQLMKDVLRQFSGFENMKSAIQLDAKLSSKMALLIQNINSCLLIACKAQNKINESALYSIKLIAGTFDKEKKCGLMFEVELQSKVNPFEELMLTQEQILKARKFFKQGIGLLLAEYLENKDRNYGEEFNKRAKSFDDSFDENLLCSGLKGLSIGSENRPKVRVR